MNKDGVLLHTFLLLSLNRKLLKFKLDFFYELIMIETCFKTWHNLKHVTYLEIHYIFKLSKHCGMLITMNTVSQYNILS